MFTESPRIDANGPEEQRLIVIFRVAGILFALKVDHLAEITQVSNINRGNSEGYFLGSVKVRGKENRILDFVRFLGIETEDNEKNISRTNSLLLLKNGSRDESERPLIGIVTDHIENVLEERLLKEFSFPDIAKNRETDIYQSILTRDNELILLLNIPRLLKKVSPP